MIWRALHALAASLALAAWMAPWAHARTDAPDSAGEAIFRHGMLSAGKSVQASRGADAGIRGAAAACSNCHRRSGLGAHEGRTYIPPITGRYLFHPRAGAVGETGLPYVEGVRADREPYTDATLARAIREGLSSEGKPLSYLMPRFALGDADMATLVGYLKRLGQRPVPGVTDKVLHFATIVTPDADPLKRRGMLDVLEHFFADKNAFQRVSTPPLVSSGKTMYSKMMFRANRHWELHVWQLNGAPATWRAQLEEHFAREPVFAVVSGLGGKDWAPVHAFCEQAALPCLFPNVEAPPLEADRDFYSLYLSKGVLLEAELMAQAIAKPESGTPIKTVRQIYRAGDSGEVAAKALAVALKRLGVAASSQPLAPGSEGLGDAMHKAEAADALVLWLRPDDVAALPGAPAASAQVYMSGLMSGLERAPLPTGWRSRTWLVQPVDLPERRRVRVDYALGWFAIRRIPIVAVQVQADTYLACGLLAETLNHMADAIAPEYLVERVEDMLEHRVLTGYYPHLTLGSGQRFASKGGYIAHFAGAEGQRLVADRDWLVP